MHALDIIIRKRNGDQLTEEELSYLVNGYVTGDIPDYQISAWLMSVFFNGLSFEETGYLTRSMIASGTQFDLSGLSGSLIDKHSTGGVGDKTSLIIAPIVAAAGLKVPMMSGRSLGHTGGTLDKLESIPGYQTSLNQADFVRILQTCGFAMTGQTKDVVPADRLLYALRDVTGTVESIPLITASILSKKCAEGAHGFVFDVKTGTGAFMKTYEQAHHLAEFLVKTAHSLNRKALALITNMNFPLGSKIGNFLEVEESFECLSPDTSAWWVETTSERVQCAGPSGELMALCLELAASMLLIGNIFDDRSKALDTCVKVLRDGSALKRFEQNIAEQGGDLHRCKSMLGNFRAPVKKTLKSPRTGYIEKLDAYAMGRAGITIGVGRRTTADTVFPDVGFEMHVRQGASVAPGQEICTVYAHAQDSADEALALIESGFKVSDTPCSREPLIQGVVRQQ